MMAHYIALPWCYLGTNLEPTCGKLATNLRLTCDLTRKISIQVVGGIIDMGNLISEKYTASQHKSNLRNIRGTFAAEGMTISKSTRSNLDRIASGQTSYQQVLTELRAKYEKSF